MLCLKLGIRYISVTSPLSLVYWARVDSLLFLVVGDSLGHAVNHWNDRELLLGLRLLNTVSVDIPSGSLELHSKDVATSISARLLLWEFGSLPVHLLHWSGLNVELVQLNGLLLGDDLLNSSQVRLWVVQSVDEGDRWLSGWVILPEVQLLETLSDIVQPRAKRPDSLE